MKNLLLESDFEPDFQIIALCSAVEGEVQFLYQLNAYFSCQFKRIEDLDIHMNGELLLYPVYEYYDKQQDLIYQLVKNKPISKRESATENSLEKLFKLEPFLLPQYKIFDYLLKGSDMFQPWSFANQLLEPNPLISASKKLTNKRIKGIEQLWF